MAFPTQTLAQLSSQARAFFTQTIPGAIASVWPNTFTIVAKVLALLGFELQLRRKWLYKQLFASTADPPALYRHGWELGLGPPAPATPATGTMAVACTPGLAIPAGLQYTRADGAAFFVQAATTPSGSSVNLPMQALAAGALGNTAAAAMLTLVPSSQAPAGLGTSGTVNAQSDGGGFEGGADAETTEHYRGRVLQRKQQPPTGGSGPDYVSWAESALSTVVEGAVFVDSFINDTRWIWLTFLVTDQANGIPSDGEVAIIQAYVTNPIRRPIAARVFVTAPTPVTLTPVVTDLVPNTAAAQAAVLAEFEAIFAENVQPATPSTPFTFYREWLDAAIDRSPGVTAGTVSNSDVTYSIAGQMPVLGTPTWPS